MNQENMMKNPIEEKKDEQKAGGMSKEEFERMSKLAVEKCCKKCIEKARRTFVHYQPFRKYVASVMLEDQEFSRIIQKVNENLTCEVLFDKVFNECALKIIEEIEEFRWKEKNTITREDFERFSFDVVSTSVKDVMRRSIIFDAHTKSEIRKEMERDYKMEFLNKQLNKNTMSRFILENIVAKMIWEVYDKLVPIDTKEDFVILCERETKECVDDLTERLNQLIYNYSEYSTDSEVMRSLRDREIGKQLVEASYRNPEYETIMNEIIKKHIMIATLDTRSKRDFKRFSDNVLEEMDRLAKAHGEALRSKSMSIREFDQIVQEALPRHQSYPKLEEAMKSNESFKKQFSTARLDKGAQINEKILEEIKQREEAEVLCHRVFKECRSFILERIEYSNAAKLEKSNFQDLLFKAVKHHKDRDEISNMFEGGLNNIRIYIILVEQYANLMVEEQRKRCESNQENVYGNNIAIQSQKNISKREFNKLCVKIFNE